MLCTFPKINIHSFTNIENVERHDHIWLKLLFYHKCLAVPCSNDNFVLIYDYARWFCLLNPSLNYQAYRSVTVMIIITYTHCQVRATSHKPDEIYGIIERLAPGSRKIELFGRPHNVQPNWYGCLLAAHISVMSTFIHYTHRGG